MKGNALSRSSGLVGRAPLVLGVLGTLLAAAVMGSLVARQGQASIFRNDAEFFWIVARDPFGKGQVLRSDPGLGVAYRFGRPLFPLLAWGLALGHRGMVRWTLMLVDVVSFGCTLSFAGSLLARQRRPPERSLLLLIIPGVWWAVVIAVSEPMVLALMLALFLAYQGGRRRAALVLAALLLLTRESAGLALVPLVVHDVRRSGWRMLGPWALTATPLLLWWTWVRVRIGQWPPLDPAESRRGALDLPFRGYWHIKGGFHPSDVFAFTLAAVTVIGGLWVWRRGQWWPISDAAALFSLLILFLGPNATRLPGELVRLIMPAQVLIVLALAGTTGADEPQRDEIPVDSG